MGVSPIKMPQLGESVTEGTVDRWLKKEGDFVKKDEPLVEVVTDKVNAEIPSPFEGKLIKISVGEGMTIAIGTEIAQIEVEGAGTMDAAAAPTERLVVDGNGRQLLRSDWAGAGMDELSANLPGWSRCQRFRSALQSAAGKDPATHRVSHRRNCKAHQ